MVILASASPRRQELIKQITSDFKVITADIDEDKSYVLSPLDAVLDIAKRKGEKIHKDHYEELVISADTIVVHKGKIIGKPIDANDAKRILKELSNDIHEVITAYCLFKKDILIEHYVISKVYFNKLSDELIDAYIKTGSPLDKAGAYGVQDNDKFPIVKSIEGSVTNVIGFPVDEIKQDFLNIEKGLLKNLKGE